MIAGYDSSLNKKEGEKEWDGERGEREIEGRGERKNFQMKKERGWKSGKKVAG